MSDQPPWCANVILWYMRLGSYLVIAFLFGVFIVSAPMLTAGVYGIILGKSIPLDIKFLVLNLLLPILGITVGVFLWIGARRYAFGPRDFKPREPVPARLLGKPIEIVIFKPVVGSGQVLFEEEGFIIQGEKTPVRLLLSRSTELRTMLVELVIKALANAATSGKFLIGISYLRISNLVLEGTTITVTYDNDIDRTAQFMVSSQDGERLYRELQLHYPDVVQEWKQFLE